VQQCISIVKDIFIGDNPVFIFRSLAAAGDFFVRPF
jgi:hypothetical protein